MNFLLSFALHKCYNWLNCGVFPQINILEREIYMSKKKHGDRNSFSGSIGFILAAAGSAVGLGNLWRFPYLAAKDTGAVPAAFHRRSAELISLFHIMIK